MSILSEYVNTEAFSASAILESALKKAQAQGKEGVDAFFSYPKRNDYTRGLVVEVRGNTALIKSGDTLTFVDLGLVATVGLKG